ncbi:hypothetical protein MtrunA17_Chr2g0289371 [Medicago truncatula]|uniref:Uncharacterized protein n=1 Tax=Medicago truncatula TaxID=3880 RepID=A0A396J8C1_MEDTR|nr:hypothetical protein MtrunA17_Chr2g0289371 [Medicago truncatula]
MGNIGCYLLTQNNLVHYGSLRRPFVNAKCPVCPFDSRGVHLLPTC